MLKWLIALQFLAIPALAQQRIVSLNLCADQLVLALAKPSQIVALSPFSRDSRLSHAKVQAAAFAQVRGAEEAVALQADMVFVGTYDRLETARLLQQRGVNVYRLPPVSTLTEAKALIADVARRIDAVEKGDKLIAELDQALIATPSQDGPTALPYERRGYALGRASLTGALLEAAGFRHPLAGATMGRFVPLEELLQLQPDVLIVSSRAERPQDQGSAMLSHPVMQRFFAASRLVVLPEDLTLCPSPGLIEALNILRQARLSR